MANNTLSWSNVDQHIFFNDKKIKIPFEVGADVLYELSSPEDVSDNIKIGKMLKAARQKAGLSQEDVAVKSGTSRNYISKVENSDSIGIELRTLEKIVRGLGAELHISIRHVSKNNLERSKRKTN